MKSSFKWLDKYRLALIGLWLAVILIVGPRGNFSLDDDWVYAAAVKHLISTGHFRLPWSSVTLVTEALYGAAFCKIFGFSFATLRCAILALGLVGILAFYETLTMLGAEALLAFLASLCLMFTPYFLNLSFTFMTDGFFCSCVLLSLWLFLRSQQNGSRRDLVIGTIIAVIATLTRQLGLFIPLAWGIVKMLERPKTVKDWVIAWASAIMTGGALIAYGATLKLLGEMPTKYDPQGQMAVKTLLHPKLLIHALTSAVPEILIYLGLFVVPVLPAIWFKVRRDSVLPRQPHLPFSRCGLSALHHC